MKENAVDIPEKRRVPTAAKFMLLCVLFERNSTASLEAILFLFFNQKIGYDEDGATVGFHTFEFLLYIFPIVGAIIADSFWGRHRTMVIMSMVVAFGLLVTAAGVVDSFSLPIKAFSIVGLLIVTLGDGCLVTLIPTFGAEQYKSTEVESTDWFFALYYFMFNIGSIISRFIAPVLREDVKCFGNDDCYPLVFGIPAILMLVVTVLVVVAKRYSKSIQAEGTTLLNILECMRYAAFSKFRSRKDRTQQHHRHWLDYSIEKYGEELVGETRIILKVFVLYLPITFFWALFYQQGSRWVSQASKMNGDLGFYTIKADQFNVINPILVIVLIPFFEHVLYPLLAKIGIKTALQKTTFGGVLAGVSFTFSAIVELLIETDRLHMTWLFPQYLLMSMGDILMTIPLMNFSFAEAPDSMKSILNALLIGATGVGNLIVVFVAGTKIVESQFYVYIFFAVLMFVDMIIFEALARRYQSIKVNRDEESELKTLNDGHRSSNEIF